MSRYKYKQIGDKICYDDNCLFFNAHMATFVSMNLNKQIKPLKIKSQGNGYRMDSQCLKLGPEEVFNRHSINSGLNVDFSKIKIQVYSNYLQDPYKFLKGGDIVRIKHAEMDSFVYTD